MLRFTLFAFIISTCIALNNNCDRISFVTPDAKPNVTGVIDNDGDEEDSNTPPGEGETDPEEPTLVVDPEDTFQCPFDFLEPTNAKSKECFNLCHVPIGHPENQHTITVGLSAIDAHLENHHTADDQHDTIGDCESIEDT